MPTEIEKQEDEHLREFVGQMVREEWVKWAMEQLSPKPSWLVPWSGLGESDKEVDRRIGERLFRHGLSFAANRLRDLERENAELRELVECSDKRITESEWAQKYRESCILLSTQHEEIERLKEILRGQNIHV